MYYSYQGTTLFANTYNIIQNELKLPKKTKKSQTYHWKDCVVVVLECLQAIIFHHGYTIYVKTLIRTQISVFPSQDNLFVESQNIQPSITRFGSGVVHLMHK